MKALKLFTAASLIVSMLTLAVGAAEFVPSAERPGEPEIISWTAEEENPNRNLIVNRHDKQGGMIDKDRFGLSEEADAAIEKEIRETMDRAATELKDNLLQHLVSGFDEHWENITGGAPLENCVVYDIFDVALICSEEQAMITDEKVTFSVKVDGIKTGDAIVVLHKPTGSDEWIIEDHEINEDGVITIFADSLSPFAIVKDSGAAPVATVTSPQTGVQDSNAAAWIAAAVLTGMGIVFASKSRCISVK